MAWAKNNFVLVLGGTETIKHPGISAAGASQEMLAYTAALDAEYLVYGRTLTFESLPVSPLGIVSPAAITKTCLDQLGIKPVIINAGAPVKPQVDCIDLDTAPALSVETGKAIEFEEVLRLYEAGRTQVRGLDICRRTRQVASEAPELTYASMRTPSEQLTQSCGKYTSPELIIAECVVGGTTTAQGLLRALGYDVSGLMSSSIPDGNHSLKAELVERGYQAALKRSDFSPELVAANPLLAISAMGDPMQAVVAGMAIECLERGISFWLAGGSQMIAIASLVEKLHRCEEQSRFRHCEERSDVAIHNAQWIASPAARNDDAAQSVILSEAKDLLTVATTHWVVNDKSAKIQELLKLTTNKTKLINPLNFGPLPAFIAQDKAFQAYDHGHVKEGVGAGALLSLLGSNK